MSVLPALYSGSPNRSSVAGPPFIPTSADNGLSIDTVSGRVVLGQNVGQVGNPARLLNNRQVPLNGFQLNFTDPVNSTLIRFNNAALNPLLIQADVNSQWSNIIAQNLNAGAAATSFLGTYNDLGDNISLVKTSSGYAGSFGYPAATGIVYSSSVGGLGANAMAFVAEAGFYWAPNTTGAGGVSQVAMRMLTNGRLQLYPIGGNATATDNGTRLQVQGQTTISMYNTIGVRTPNTSVFAVVNDGSLTGTIASQQTSNTATGPIIGMYKSRGTDPTTPATTQANDIAGRILWQAVDTTNVVRTIAEMRGFQEGAAVGTAVAGTLIWFTTEISGAVIAKMIMNSVGQLSIGYPPTFPAPAAARVYVSQGHIGTPGTTGNTFYWNAPIAAPGVTAGPVFANYYGGNTNALGDPVEWVLINVNGTDRKVPCYAV